MLLGRPVNAPGSELPPLLADPGLCGRCRHARLARSARSTFLRCALAATDPRFPRYPALPVLVCSGFDPGEAEAGARERSG